MDPEPENAPASAKRVYHPPELIEYGDLSESFENDRLMIEFSHPRA